MAGCECVCAEKWLVKKKMVTDGPIRPYWSKGLFDHTGQRACWSEGPFDPRAHLTMMVIDHTGQRAQEVGGGRGGLFDQAGQRASQTGQRAS